jgi:RHS repeat-associated protein
LQETTYEGGVATKKVIYTIGHDQISQTILLPLPNGGEGWGEGATHWFGTDGHGSVRVLYDFAATIVKDAANFNRLQVYTFDAYGNLQGWPTSSLTPNTLPLTTYLYSGESFDFNIGQQYLRARFYDATTGRFNRLDPFAGNSSDPQSFHKYAYVHGDPIQGIDPTGMFFSLVGFLGTAGLVGVGLQATHLGLTLYNELRAQSLRISATGIGGRSIDGKLEKLGADLELQWGKANASTRRRLFEAAHTSAGWEIVEFKQSQLESRMNPLGQVPRSISLKENVYLKVEVNYFLWGALNYLAHKEGLSTTTIVGTNNGSINQMSEIARRYRAITNFAYVHVENDGSIDGRVAWAKAGWRFMETKVLAEPVWTRLKRAIPDLTASPEINGYIGSPDGIANPVTLLFGSHTRS